ncbi:MAG: TRAP transporter substrate-binding protein DctP [Spirochaetales bacterium]|nr:TRAP transporter substrate-binding protein DctP [Spirochaetales bacterium]
MRHRWALVLLVGILFGSLQVEAQVIKVGSVAPEGSPWDRALKRIALDWQKISGGRVTLKIYSGGIAGDEPDMIRKMRINQIQAAAMSGSGLGKIDPDWLVYQLPFLTQNDEELDYLFERLRPELERRMEDKGFTFLAIIKSGWLRFFAKEKVVTPDDFRKLKFFVMEGSPEVDQAWKIMGFHIVPLPPNDAFAALQSGMVEIFTASPLTAAAMQWFALAPHMTDINWTPFTAGLVISNQAWRRIPRELQPKLKAATRSVLADLEAEIIELENQAMEIMKDNGLIVHQVPPAVQEEWEELVQEGFKILVGDVISRDLYEQARQIISEY